MALVIGNGAYQNAPKLPNPARDAKAVADALRGLDFEVIEAVDLDQPDMQARLDEFSGRLEGADTGLFYYAGHGLQVGGENFLVPIDARLQREAQVFYQTTPLETVLRTMEAAVATRLVLLDACRDNPLAQQLKRSMAASRSSTVGQGLAEVRTAVGTLIAYATGPGDVASDGKGEHSPFTSALLDHIATPGLEVRQVLGRVRDEVLKQTGERQVPWDSSSLRGEFYFKPSAPEPEPESRQRHPCRSRALRFRSATGGFDERQIDLGFWESMRGSGKAADFEAYLQSFPNGIFAALARSKLEDLGARRMRLLMQQRKSRLPAQRRCHHRLRITPPRAHRRLLYRNSRSSLQLLAVDLPARRLSRYRHRRGRWPARRRRKPRQGLACRATTGAPCSGRSVRLALTRKAPTGNRVRSHVRRWPGGSTLRWWKIPAMSARYSAGCCSPNREPSWH